MLQEACFEAATPAGCRRGGGSCRLRSNITAHEAILAGANLESRGAGVIGGSHAVFLGQREHKSARAADGKPKPDVYFCNRSQRRNPG
jgi:hypothetical protein